MDDAHREIHTEGGHAIEGDVGTQGGDFIGGSQYDTGGAPIVEGDVANGQVGRENLSNTVQITHAPPDFANNVILYLTQLVNDLGGVKVDLRNLNEKVITQATEIQNVKHELNRQGHEQTRQMERITAIEREVSSFKQFQEESRRDRADLRRDVNRVEVEVKNIPSRVPAQQLQEQTPPRWESIGLMILVAAVAISLVMHFLQWLN